MSGEDWVWHLEAQAELAGLVVKKMVFFCLQMEHVWIESLRDIEYGLFQRIHLSVQNRAQTRPNLY